MAEILFIDRTGESETLTRLDGERISDTLKRHNIPPCSVLVTEDSVPIPDLTIPTNGRTYAASLIEGFNISEIRSAYDDLDGIDFGEAAYVKQRLLAGVDGSLQTEAVPLTLDEVVEYVDATVAETCNTFNLLSNDSQVLVGLSGGVDSTSLLMALAALREHLTGLKIFAVTFEDADMRAGSPTLAQARSVAEAFDVEHLVAPATLAAEIFGLNRPLEDVLTAMMSTPVRHHAMYADSHTTRRVLEHVAADRGIDRIALGLHATDLIAGLLNGFMTGYPSGPLPLRPIADISFVYPLALLAKRELHMYYYSKTGKFARHANPNEWERHPVDRNFYYYLADQLQSLWPSLELLLITAQERSARSIGPIDYGRCNNCGGTYAQLPFTAVADDQCDVCRIFDEAGFLNER